MNRKDILLILFIVALLPLWQLLDRHVIKKHFFHEPPRPTVAEVAAAPVGETAAPEAAVDSAAPEATPSLVEAEAAAAPEETVAPAPEQTVLLENGNVRLTISSRGAAVRDATLKAYRATLDTTSGPVFQDFSSRPALAYQKLPGLDAEADFTLTAAENGRRVAAERRLASGLSLRRTFSLKDTYVVEVADEFVNTGSAVAALPAHLVQLGPMTNEVGQQDSAGFVTLGVDSLSPGGEDVQHWARKVSDLFKDEQAAQSLAKLPVQMERAPRERAVDWVAAKSKYFVQSLAPIAPEGGGDYATVYARRTVTDREKADPGYKPKMTPVQEISAALAFSDLVIQPGQSFHRAYQYYVGPKKWSELHALSFHQVRVMELGDWLRPIATVLLRTMNFMHGLWPHNYGLAIMLLTLVIKIVFWPITHKSTQSMKRMMEVQPLMKEIQEKYKSDPKKMQQEMMALYKEHKINPLGGCLPMLIQIPIFIALFYVLRSAIELRFASFLWIDDLSAPENLLAGVLPIPLNILPLLMAATMYFQQKLTPTTGDPTQAQIMRVMMPIMMLIFLYNYASGLALYWTTQNLLMIVQQLMMQRAQKKHA